MWLSRASAGLLCQPWAINVVAGMPISRDPHDPHDPHAPPIAAPVELDRLFVDSPAKQGKEPCVLCSLWPGASVPGKCGVVTFSGNSGRLKEFGRYEASRAKQHLGSPVPPVSPLANQSSPAPLSPLPAKESKGSGEKRTHKVCAVAPIATRPECAACCSYLPPRMHSPFERQWRIAIEMKSLLVEAPLGNVDGLGAPWRALQYWTDGMGQPLQEGEGKALVVKYVFRLVP